MMGRPKKDDTTKEEVFQNALGYEIDTVSVTKEIKKNMKFFLPDLVSEISAEVRGKVTKPVKLDLVIKAKHPELLGDQQELRSLLKSNFPLGYTLEVKYG